MTAPDAMTVCNGPGPNLLKPGKSEAEARNCSARHSRAEPNGTNSMDVEAAGPDARVSNADCTEAGSRDTLSRSRRWLFDGM